MEAVDSEHYRHQATVMRTDNIQAGDYFLLCTDGVLNCVTDDQLLELLNDTTTSTADKMAALAQCCADSTDNNTAWLIAIDRVDGDSASIFSKEDDADAAPDSQPTKRMTYPRKGTTDIDPQPENKKSSWIKRIFS
jgi:protein phosphatase